jgi:hypothetical protein
VFAANGLIDGKNREESLKVSSSNANEIFTPAANPSGPHSAYELKANTSEKLIFVLYYEVGGAKLHNWRLTWIQTKIE